MVQELLDQVWVQDGGGGSRVAWVGGGDRDRDRATVAVLPAAASRKRVVLCLKLQGQGNAKRNHGEMNNNKAERDCN